MSELPAISIHLVRFESLHTAGTITPEHPPGLLFCGVGADVRASATLPASQQAFRFLVLGIHADETSANRFIDHGRKFLPWMDESVEIWRAVLQPFYHKGEANYLDQRNPGALFNSLADSPGPHAPIAVITTSGWVMGDQLDMNRVKEFSDGVMSVRASMTAVEGMHSQQSFFFPGVLTYDPITVTLWRDAVSLGKFAYGPGVHRMQIERQRSQNLADRTSFTRCKILRGEGTWHGKDPISWKSDAI